MVRSISKILPNLLKSQLLQPLPSIHIFSNSNHISSLTTPLNHQPINLKDRAKLQKYIQQMIEICIDNGLSGLSGNQIGGNKRIVVVAKHEGVSKVKMNGSNDKKQKTTGNLWISPYYNNRAMFDILIEPKLILHDQVPSLQEYKGRKVKKNYRVYPYLTTPIPTSTLVLQSNPIHPIPPCQLSYPQHSISLPFLTFQSYRPSNISLQYLKYPTFQSSTIKSQSIQHAHLLHHYICLLDGRMPIDWRLNRGEMDVVEEVKKYFPKTSKLVNQYREQVKGTLKRFPQLLLGPNSSLGQSKLTQRQYGMAILDNPPLSFEKDLINQITQRHRREFQLLMARAEEGLL